MTMNDLRSQIAHEVIGEPTETMRRYLSHFGGEADSFIGQLTAAAETWEKYSSIKSTKHTEEHTRALGISGAYFLNSINAALVSMRLLLSGFLIASGNASRHGVESLAFGILLPFPNSHAFRDWDEGKGIEHKAIERLIRNAETCGVRKGAVQELAKQAKWFDQFSHPSRIAIANLSDPDTEPGFFIGSTFVEKRLPFYKKDADNRISLAKFIDNTIRGTAASLTKKGLIDPASWA
jgi:hypothetical protein